MTGKVFKEGGHLEYAIEAKGLSKSFGQHIAINQLDLQIPKGRIYGFLGPNGCGKSTCIRLLTGLLEASNGESKYPRQTSARE
ncbi:ATP-binding cassette domain-containing protein [Paucibacter sp. O1-1]|nr:ATP-binding cassette domain-containing protein [Paucibacter sp. O1-1]MDA3824322.1 ATP-binding cassette domain-containing protein [Paucibacter sp. O1-1]